MASRSSGAKGSKFAELPNRADGILSLPSPIVPLFVGNVTPERMAFRFTGRLVFVDAEFFEWDIDSGTLFGFVHKIRNLQQDIGYQGRARQEFRSEPET